MTTSYLWFALTFWVYIETTSVLATGIIGGSYMLLVAFCSMLFGTLVDRYRKIVVMRASSIFTVVAFALAGGIFVWRGSAEILRLDGPWFWLFSGVLLLGAIVEQMRNIALSTTVTLLVPEQRRANANGMVGTVQGVGLIVTSVLSGLSVGRLGMGGTLVIAIVAITVSALHIMFVRIPEPAPERAGSGPSLVDIRGSFSAVSAAPGLWALVIFATFNNLIGGVYLALMDPYGLTLFSVEMWGVVFAVASTGFLVGGSLVAMRGLGRNPMRTMLLVVILMGVLGALFTIREWPWLFVAGMWLYMLLVPAVEAAEQTVIQKVVPFETQGRVFGLATTFEAGAGPITAFAIAPIAEFLIIPYMRTPEGAARWHWLLGIGDARGIALVMVFAGIALVIVAVWAFTTRSYRRLSEQYARAPEAAPVA